MKNQDQVILREIQKSARMGMESIEALMPHVQKESFAREISSQAMSYGSYYDKATNELKKAEKRLYKDSVGKHIMLRSGIWMKTFMDNSTSHMAEMMIQGANMGLTDMYKVIHKNKHASEETMDIAKGLMDMEEKSITALREYL